MECVEAALKTGSRKDMVLMKLRPQAFSDDLLALNAHQNATSNNDDDFVDDLLDFSNNDVFPEELEGEEDEEEEQEDIVNDQRKQKQQQGGGAAAANDVVSVSLEQKDDFGLVPHFPADDLADLEWLSHFVEDSFSQFTDPLSAGALQQKPPSRLEPETLSSGSERLSFKTQVPSKARSKRSRTGGRVWSLSRISLTEPSSCSSSSTTSSSPTSPWSEPTEPETKPPVKKQEQKKRPAAASEVLRSAPFGPVVQPPRRCSHCGVQKTPQWRAGPHGAKTLCNACGVRFKSGRLYPEYRPACSPTFCSELHSNHHRKVMEMRRKKESLGQPEPGRAVPSF